MIRLSQGSVAPVVTTLQILLRRHRPHAQIKSDGQFGSKTKGAAVGFQNQHGLDPDGIVGRFTWTQAMSVSNLLTIDVVDGTDPSLVALEAADIVAAGGDPIVVFGMSGGVDFVMNQIAGRARGPESIALLRFHGHGNRGQQNLTGGDLNGAPTWRPSLTATSTRCRVHCNASADSSSPSGACNCWDAASAGGRRGRRWCRNWRTCGECR